MINDKILIENWRVAARVGCTDDERSSFQDIMTTIKADLLDNTAAGTDDLADTADYQMIAKEVREMLQIKQFNLLESLCQSVADIALGHNNVSQVWVSAKKTGIVEGADFVGVEITRSK